VCVCVIVESERECVCVYVCVYVSLTLTLTLTLSLPICHIILWRVCVCFVGKVSTGDLLSIASQDVKRAQG
jgi:hypothetical protein